MSKTMLQFRAAPTQRPKYCRSDYMLNQLNLQPDTPARPNETKRPSRWSNAELRDLWVAAVLFTLSFIVFYSSPNVQVGDSHYSMLLSLNIARHGSFQLDRYFMPPREPVKHPNRLGLDPNYYPIDYSISVNDGHYYYVYPPGTSVLSVPFVAALNGFGLSPAKPDDTYDRDAEVKIELLLSAFLMALFVAACYGFSRQFLPLGWSILIAASTAFATPVWSTATRAMWGHAWSVLLLGAVIKLLVDLERGKGRSHPYLLASLLSWMYFVRPTNSITIAAIAVYILVRQRGIFLKFALTGCIWLGLFLVWSQHYFHQWLPAYFHNYDQLGFAHGYLKALAGLLVSPSRGLFIYVPILFTVLVLLIRHWRILTCRHLAWLALACISGSILMTAAISSWHGGGSYGPRYSTDYIPWLVLLAVFSVKAMLGAAGQPDTPKPRFSLGLWISGLLLALSVFIHARGAIAYDTGVTWSVMPVPMEQNLGRLWDWRRPQFMEGLTDVSRRLAHATVASESGQPLTMKVNAKFPLLRLGSRISMASPDSDDYVVNFSPAGSDVRNTLAKHAEIHFTPDQYEMSQLRIYMQPILFRESQRVDVTMNGLPLASFTLREPGLRVYTLVLPRNFWKEHNVIGFDMPDASSQRTIGIGRDERILSIGIQWFELIRETPVDEALPPPASAEPPHAAK